MTKATISLVDFSYDWPQYYVPPCGGAIIGVGATAMEAAMDCIECLYMMGHSISGADERAIIEQAEQCPPADDEPECDEEDPCMDGPWWYCAVQVADEE
jgi:hypothetical protein